MKLKNVVLFFGIVLIGFDAWTQNHGTSFSKTAFKYDEAKGIGHETGCTRRDPSDVIKVVRYLLPLLYQGVRQGLRLLGGPCGMLLQRMKGLRGKNRAKFSARGRRAGLIPRPHLPQIFFMQKGSTGYITPAVKPTPEKRKRGGLRIIQAQISQP